jgi:hypothetical protein
MHPKVCAVEMAKECFGKGKKTATDENDGNGDLEQSFS